jgi:nitrogen fixation protein FixH
MITMTQTLFGGMLAVALLFFVGRRFSLPAYWSALLAGLLPFLGYLGFGAEGHGGDVLAIHFVVFLATAAVMGVFSATSKKKEKMHWAPKLLIAFFVFLALFNAALLSVATNGLPDWLTGLILPHESKVPVHTVFPGVIPHDRNKSYVDQQAHVEQQRKLGWQVEVQGLEGIKAGTRQTITLSLKDAAGQPLVADRVMLGFWRMANSKDDRWMNLQAAEPGVYKAEVLLEDEGRWIVETHIERGQDVYHTKRSLLVDEAGQ